MTHLRDAFLELPTWEGILLIGGVVALVALLALVVHHFSFRAGVAHAEFRADRIRSKRHELEAIV